MKCKWNWGAEKDINNFTAAMTPSNPSSYLPFIISFFSFYILRISRWLEAGDTEISGNTLYLRLSARATSTDEMGRWPPPPRSVSRSLPQGSSGSVAAGHRGLEQVCLWGGRMSARITLYQKKPRQESKLILFFHYIIPGVFTGSLSFHLSVRATGLKSLRHEKT